jgi:6-phosphogluconolactonase
MSSRITPRCSVPLAWVAMLVVLNACADDATTHFPTAAAPSRTVASGSPTVGGVFVTTNAVAGNAVVAFERHADGTLTAGGTFPTGGAGTGGSIDPLQSQSALTLGEGNRRLYVVNAGSNSISTFSVDGSTLTLLETVPSGGTFPVSVSSTRGRLFVLNAGSNAVAEFALGPDGTPGAIPLATADLGTPASGASTIGVSPDGHFVVVTERDANAIDVFTVAPDGSLSAPFTTHSNGNVPFGFDFTPRGQLVISEAGGAAPNGAVSTYGQNADGSLSLVSGSLSTQQAATCWLVVSHDGRFAFAVNSASGSISSYGVRPDGSATLLSADGRTAVTGNGTAPLDLGLSSNGRFLYVVNAAAGTIGGFTVGADGSLKALPVTTGLAAASGVQGLAAY